MEPRDVLTEIADLYLRIRHEHLGDLTPEAASAIEVSSDFEADAVKLGFWRAELSALVAADSARGVATALADTTLGFAPFVIARTCLEATAIALWLLHPDADPAQRMARAYEVRFAELDQGRKLAGATGNAELHDLMTELLAKLATSAPEIGVDPRADRGGKTIGYGAERLNLTDLCSTLLDAPGEYRYLSAVLHGASWALVRAALKQTAEQWLFEAPYYQIERTPGADRYLVEITANNLIACTGRVLGDHGWDLSNYRTDCDSVCAKTGIEISWLGLANG